MLLKDDAPLHTKGLMNRCCGLGEKCPVQAMYHPLLMALFGWVIEPLGGTHLLGETGHWRQSLTFIVSSHFQFTVSAYCEHMQM